MPLVSFVHVDISIRLCIYFNMYSGGEMLSVAEPFLEQQMHPTVIISAFRLALEDLLEVLKKKIR